MKLLALVLAADATDFVTVNRVAGVTGVACPKERFRDIEGFDLKLCI